MAREIKQRVKKTIFIGPTMQKALLLLEASVALSLTHRPDTYFRILKGVAREWKAINQRTLYRAIRNLYKSKLVNYKENDDGTVTLILSEEGQKRVLRYKLEDIKIKKPTVWDKMWRVVLFDIPEDKKDGRDALARKLKELGFRTLQKSVFIYPYECKDEIDFIVEIFELSPYVRFMRVRETDIDLDLKHYFKL